MSNLLQETITIIKKTSKKVPDVQQVQTIKDYYNDLPRLNVPLIFGGWSVVNMMVLSGGILNRKQKSEDKITNLYRCNGDDDE